MSQDDCMFDLRYWMIDFPFLIWIIILIFTRLLREVNLHGIIFVKTVYGIDSEMCDFY